MVLAAVVESGDGDGLGSGSGSVDADKSSKECKHSKGSLHGRRGLGLLSAWRASVEVIASLVVVMVVMVGMVVMVPRWGGRWGWR